MQRDIWVIFLHTLSNDEYPQHGFGSVSEGSGGYLKRLKHQCLSPPHAYTMGMKQMTGWVSRSGAHGSNLKSGTQTGAKIL
ncbi:hypothetical protein TNCV_2700171 [Trichonephila clavipes]|nr:hypothetical protein TNCV_2700171 [Trichonephila clavipes]